MKDYHKCISCGCTKYFKYKYDNHLGLRRSYLNRMSIARAVLPYLDFLIPESVPRLKRISSGKDVFSGHVLICSNCGYGVLNKPPNQSEVESFYSHQYSLLKIEESGAKEPDAYKNCPRANSQLQFINHYLYKKRIRNILEIGAGSAFASQLLRDKYKEAELFVCEPGEQWDEYYTERKILRVADFFPFESKIKFDYIHTSHWLEHVRNLESTLISLGDLLSQEGLIFVEVPNTQHDYWNLQMSDTPHIHFFTMSSLKNILEKFPFSCVKIGEFGITFKEREQRVRISGDDFRLTSEDYGPKEKGFWIRALFKKGQEVTHNEAEDCQSSDRRR